MDAMKKIVIGFALSVLVCGIAKTGFAQSTNHSDSKQTCRVIHGRAMWYRGDGFFAIWHIGTHHIFSPADRDSADLICQYFDCESGDRQPALFADFTICPTEPYQDGAAQNVIVKRVEHPIVFTDWPAPTSPREYVQGFYKWYAARVSSGNTDLTWMKILKLARWDLSPELASLLEEDAAAQSHCREIVGIDFDPFLFSQDPAKKYEVGAIEQKGDKYWAKIYAAEDRERSSAPDVIAEIARRSDGGWFFVNFYNPRTGTKLLAILKSSRLTCTAPTE